MKLIKFFNGITVFIYSDSLVTSLLASSSTSGKGLINFVLYQSFLNDVLI